MRKMIIYVIALFIIIEVSRITKDAQKKDFFDIKHSIEVGTI